MQQYNKILALAMGVCLFDMTPSLAASTSASTDSSQASLESAIQKVNLQTLELQKEVKRLRAELQKMKQSKQPVKYENKKHQNKSVVAAQTASHPAVFSPVSGTLANIPKLHASPIVNASLPAGSTDLDPSAFISYQNGMSQGLFFLKQRQALEKLLKGAPLPSASKPQVILSGKLEGQAIWQDPYNGQDTSSIDLVTAELDTYLEVSPWASGFMAIEYNNSSLNQVLLGSGNPVNNSNIFLNRGYITIGNLSKSPIYFNTGQMYVPFGAYSTYMLTNPVTKVLGRTNTRAAELGYSKDGLNFSVYAFNGSATTGSGQVDNWGLNGNYDFNFGEYNATLGAGFINDLSDAQGAQQTGSGTSGTFQGFSQSPVSETLVHYVPGVDLNAYLSRGPLYFAAEGIMATREYDPTDMSFNGVGAQPKAAHFELGYIFKAFEKRSTFSIAYEETWEALALGLAKNSYVATLNTSIWKNTVETLEFRHDVNYASGDTSAGACSFTNASGTVIATTCPGSVTSGGQQNTILLQFGVYF